MSNEYVGIINPGEWTEKCLSARGQLNLAHIYRRARAHEAAASRNYPLSLRHAAEALWDYRIDHAGNVNAVEPERGFDGGAPTATTA